MKTCLMLESEKGVVPVAVAVGVPAGVALAPAPGVAVGAAVRAGVGVFVAAPLGAGIPPTTGACPVVVPPPHPEAIAAAQMHGSRM